MAKRKATAVVTAIPKKGDESPDGHIILKFASCDMGSEDKEKPMIECTAKVHKGRSNSECHEYYAAEFEVETTFGDIGAVVVEIPEGNEKYIETVYFYYSSPRSTTTFSCNSWVQPKNFISHDRRIFFSTKSYLLEHTPKGLLKLRKEDLANLRGERDKQEDMNKRYAFERIYNYDVYNDLGDPDHQSMELKRPVLGGPEHPYPRRCRTGRPPSVRDPRSERRGTENFYVPRDEEFSEVKQKLFPEKTGPTGPYETKSFDNFTQIDSLFGDGIELPPELPANERQAIEAFLQQSFLEDPSEYSTFADSKKLALKPPEGMKNDKFIWLSDSEFARQTLAGLNPYGIQRVKSNLPLESKLDEGVYGDKKSKLHPDLITKLIGIDSMTADKAVEQKKLYMLDYHDTLMQYVKKVRGVKGTTLYGSRTLFFLDSDDTLRPLAIELTRPPMDGKLQWKKVFTPSTHATENWLWRLAKAHVLAHDSCFHQLIVHWLRTHCAVEPYIIATNRQLSTVHPIYRLLHPHFRFTIRINSNARQTLINAGGIIESTFSTAKYSMELSSLVYKEEWKFDLQGLPEDLVHRGMAANLEGGGVELYIKDYPFANDGLMLWAALEKWVTDYVEHYYTADNLVKNDAELKAWWEEIKEKGHPDKKGEGVWPKLETREELIKIVTKIAWVACGHHSAVNFGQYGYSAYFPSRPSIARTNMPTEDSTQHPEDVIAKPETVLLQSFPSVAQALGVAKTLWVLSAHSEDEEYLGEKMELSWRDDPDIANAFDRLKKKLEKLESTIDERNCDVKLKNRRGAGRVPYEAFKPSSYPGVTGKGVPYSIST